MLNHTALSTAKSPLAAMALRSLSKNWGFTNATEGTQPGLITLFAVETCEVCDCEIQAANAINVKGTLEDAKAGGLTVGHRLDEGGYCDAISAVACSSCYSKATTLDESIANDRAEALRAEAE